MYSNSVLEKTVKGWQELKVKIRFCLILTTQTGSSGRQETQNFLLKKLHEISEFVAIDLFKVSQIINPVFQH